LPPITRKIDWKIARKEDGPAETKNFTPNKTHPSPWGQVKTDKRNNHLPNAKNPAIQLFWGKKILKKSMAMF